MKRNNSPLSAESFNRLRDRRNSQNIDRLPNTVEHSLEERLWATAFTRSSIPTAEVTQVPESEDTQIFDINSTQIFTAADELRGRESQAIGRTETKPEYFSQTRGIHNPALERSVTPPPAPPLQESSIQAIQREIEVRPRTQDEMKTEILNPIRDDIPPRVSSWPPNLIDRTEIIDEYEPPEILKPAKTTRRRMGKSAFISLSIFTAGTVMIVPAMGANRASKYIYGNEDMSMSERIEDGWNGTVDFYKGIVGLGE